MNIDAKSQENTIESNPAFTYVKNNMSQQSGVNPREENLVQNSKINQSIFTISKDKRKTTWSSQ